MVMLIDEERQLVMVKGSVPGASNGKVEIRMAVKNAN